MLYADARVEDNYLYMFPCSMPMHLLRITTYESMNVPMFYGDALVEDN